MIFEDFATKIQAIHDEDIFVEISLLAVCKASRVYTPNEEQVSLARNSICRARDLKSKKPWKRKKRIMGNNFSLFN